MKKILDEKCKLFGKINIIDLLVVVAILVLIFASIIKFENVSEQMTSDKTIEYTVEVVGIRQPSVDAIKKKLEGITEIETEKELGNVVDVKVTPTKELVHLNDGSYKEVELVNKYTALLTIEVSGTETKDNYYTSTGKKLIVGESISLYNDYVVSYGNVKSVKVIEK